MQLRHIRLWALIGALALSASLVEPAQADSINAGTTECQPLSASPHNVVHSWVGTGTDVNAPASVVSCAVPRSPLSGAAGQGTFEISAWIVTAGASINCTLYSYDYTGLFLGSVSFTLATATPTTQTPTMVSRQVSLPVTQLGFWAYTSMSCIVPANDSAFVTYVVSTL
jgi:hypothetical protein